MSKGDKRRPTLVQERAFEANWARVFGHTNITEDASQPMPPQVDVLPNESEPNE